GSSSLERMPLGHSSLRPWLLHRSRSEARFCRSGGEPNARALSHDPTQYVTLRAQGLSQQMARLAIAVSAPTSASGDLSVGWTVMAWESRLSHACHAQRVSP